MRAKRTKKTRADWAPRFLEALSDRGVILHACTVANVSRANVYQRRDADQAFAAAMATALEEACDRLEEEARRRAFIGVARKKFTGKGEPILDPTTGEQYVEHEYSDSLLQLLLRAHRPEKYRENHKIEHGGRVQLTVRAEELTDDELAAIAAGTK